MEIRRGSIIATLVAMTRRGRNGPTESSAHFDAFYARIHRCYEFLRDPRRRRVEFDKSSLRNLDAIIEPVAQEPGSRMLLTPPAEFEMPPTEITSNQAHEVQANIKAEIQRLEAPSTSQAQDIVIHWYQARNDRFSKAGDRAIIPGISEKPVKVLFADESLKTRMLLTNANPFQLQYTVDANIDFAGRDPKLCLITAFHGAEPLVVN
jgi:hypothetical protein